MAFSFGFFNSKNLDRTYTAENFNDYLGSIICDGIQDNFGQCFKLSASKLKLTIGSGKAWIQGRYFISDTAYTYDLSRYVDESLTRYMAVGICCNTSENVRNVSFEILAGTPATNPVIPRFRNTDYKKYLTLCIINLMQAHQNSALQTTGRTIISVDMSAVFLANARSQICFHSFLKFRRR